MKENKLDYLNNSVVNIYIVYKIDNNRNTDFTIQNALFGAVKITKDSNSSNNKSHGYGICLDCGSGFSFGNRIDAKNNNFWC